MSSEHVCRNLVPLAPNQQRRVWNAAVQANAGEAPTAKQIAELRRELYPESYEQAPKSEPTNDQGDISPEDWLSQGQQLARDQRLSERLRVNLWSLTR
jgi:hypothetical protein